MLRESLCGLVNYPQVIEKSIAGPKDFGKTLPGSDHFPIKTRESQVENGLTWRW
jgi:hypothetical protein